MAGPLVDDRDPLQPMHIILGALQTARDDHVVKAIVNIKTLCIVGIPSKRRTYKPEIRLNTCHPSSVTVAL